MEGPVMRAVQYECYGGGAIDLMHVEVPVPAPGKGEVLLKLEAASLNPVDWKMQMAPNCPFFPRKLPYIPVGDVAGEVLEVGAGVKGFKQGDKVVAYAFAGGLAEYVVSEENLTVPRPLEVSAAAGAGLPTAALIAHMSLTQSADLKLDGTGPQKNILITGASGGVGHYAVQLAKLGNAHVTATCSARNLDFVKSLGADEVLDYNTKDGKALRSPSGKKYDVVLHCAPPFPWSVFEPNLSTNGKVMVLTPDLSSFRTFARTTLMFSKKKLVLPILFHRVEHLRYLVELVKEGKLKTIIDSKYPLCQAESAWAKIMKGHVAGKVIIEPETKNVQKVLMDTVLSMPSHSQQKSPSSKAEEQFKE